MTPRENVVTRIQDEKWHHAIEYVLRHEGGFVDDPNDDGGPTHYGVSLRFLKDIGMDINDDSDIDIKDVQELTLNDVKLIYKQYWWDKYEYTRINDRLIAAKVFDLAVNMGAHMAHKILQRACNEISEAPIADDGILGEITLAVVNILIEKGRREELLSEIKEEAASFYILLVMEKPKFKRYLKGWLARVND